MQTTRNKKSPAGWWVADGSETLRDREFIKDALIRLGRPVYVVEDNGQLAVTQSGRAIMGSGPKPDEKVLPLLAYAPPLQPSDFGHADFKKSHGLRYAYLVGAMANGISSVELVTAAGLAGMVGFFGAAGLLPEEVEAAIDQIEQRLAGKPFGFNLIHSPAEPDLESAVVGLYLRREVRLVSASAYLNLTLPLLRYRYSGIRRDAAGRVICPNKVIAKVSRIEVARKFLSPPPQKLLAQLVSQQLLSSTEAELAATVPVARDITAEADSGGHTDNRPAITLLPTLMALRDEISQQQGYLRPPHIGLAGGIATPTSAAAAFAMGADYILTGSINQACVEAGTSEAVRGLLAAARQADVAMAPSADMFEMGVKVQVLKRGTMFAQRASKLYELYSTYPDYSSIPADQRDLLEKDYFRRSFADEWESTRAFFKQRDPRQIELANSNSRHQMALVFRSYLGQSSSWANNGEPTRQIDYQIWCGPAMGAFNQWVLGTFLEEPQNRDTVTVALNLLVGAAVITRANWLRQQGLALSSADTRFNPLPREILTAKITE